MSYELTRRVFLAGTGAAGVTILGQPWSNVLHAADGRVVVRVEEDLKILDPAYPGTYKVMDTGSEIKGRDIDIFMPSCRRAKLFGRKTMRVRIVTRAAAVK